MSFAVPMPTPLKIHQLDPDLQARVRGLTLTTLSDFKAMAQQIRSIQESRWAQRSRVEPAKPRE